MMHILIAAIFIVSRTQLVNCEVHMDLAELTGKAIILFDDYCRSKSVNDTFIMKVNKCILQSNDLVCSLDSV